VEPNEEPVKAPEPIQAGEPVKAPEPVQAGEPIEAPLYGEPIPDTK
jgi:hypothetical protein